MSCAAKSLREGSLDRRSEWLQNTLCAPCRRVSSTSFVVHASSSWSHNRQRLIVKSPSHFTFNTSRAFKHCREKKWYMENNVSARMAHQSCSVEVRLYHTMRLMPFRSSTSSPVSLVLACMTFDDNTLDLKAGLCPLGGNWSGTPRRSLP